jgi:hypothetical protein
VAAGLVVEEVTAGGFTLLKVIEDWPGRGPLKSYCAIFRKPEAPLLNRHDGPRATSNES